MAIARPLQICGSLAKGGDRKGLTQDVQIA